jgi:hypothetical protein
MTNKHKNLLLLILIIAFGIFLRTININRYLTWQDEAETIINSIQVIEDGYPHGYFKGKPMFESISFIKINDPIYRYASANYYGSKYENNKGWLTYYYLAPFIKTFGVSETSTRLPFLLFYVLTTIVLYAFSNKLFKNKKIALLATFIFAIDYFAIYHGQQARYYSIFIFLNIWSLYLNYLYLHSKKNIHLFWLTTSLILMFHTHIVLCLFLGLFFIYYDFIKTKKIKFNRYIIYNLAYFLLFTIPWLILVEFWVNFSTHDINNNKELTKLLWLLLIILVPIIIKYIFITIGKREKLRISKKINTYIFTFFSLYIIFVPLIIPAESLTTRILSPLIPLSSIAFAILFWQIFIYKKEPKKYIIILLTGLLIYIPLFRILKANGYGTANGIIDILDYAEKIKLSNDDLLTVNWQDFPIALKSDYNVYLTQTLQPDFYNNYPNRILTFFMYDHLYINNPTVHRTWLQQHDFWLYQDQFQDYKPRLEQCQKDWLNNHVLVFDCPALSE